MSFSTAPVTVIIPCLNAEQTLGDALDSVFAQTVRPMEVLVIDDHSTDRSAVVARKHHPSVRPILALSLLMAVRRAGRAREVFDGWRAMISLEDCVGLTGLAEEVVLALAEHEHLPAVSAAGLACDLLAQPEGCRRIAAMIADDINWALARGDRRHAENLRATLCQFASTQPDAMTSLRAQACLAAN